MMVELFKSRELSYSAWGETSRVRLFAEQYPNGRLALSLWAPVVDSENGAEVEMGLEPYMTITVNIPEAPLMNDEILVKDWSENEGIDDWLMEQEIVMKQPWSFFPCGYTAATKRRLHHSVLLELAQYLPR